MVLSVHFASAQNGKKLPAKKTQFFNNIFNKVKSSITVSPQDSTVNATVLNTKSVIPFIEYEGKIIRLVHTEELGFEKVFTDTSKFLNYYGTKLLNKLHVDTYDWVIRDNLFIKKGSRLNPYLVSDNERYLRSLEFIQDARIIVRPVNGSTDSVDVFVFTKDLFSITGSLDISGIDRQRVTVAESNLAGAGQKVQATTLHDVNRAPNFGFDFLYSKNSLLHTFVNGTVGYSKINRDGAGNENIESFYTMLDRPLYSPYSRGAGGLQLSFNTSKNLLDKPDSLFYNYKNVNIDVWAGYNIGVNKLKLDIKNRNRAFVAFRYIKNNFIKKPFQVGSTYNNFFNDRKAFLGEVTFFKQDFYKTNYIYGFGTTEDVPYGYNIAFTGGWYKQNNLARPYFGINANHYIASAKGKFLQYFIRAGTFLNKGLPQDASVLLGGSLYSKLYVFKHFKMRQYFKASFTRLYNRITYDPIQINNTLGLRYFSADTLRGTQRISIYGETFFFAKYKLLGFQLAPFVFADASLLTGETRPFKKSDIYTGVGGGVRTRNVNLIFGTTELRLVYFPRKAQDTNSFVVSFNTDILFRYKTNYVRAPDIIQLNSEDANSFY